VLREPELSWSGTNVVDAFLIRAEKDGSRPLVWFRDNGVYTPMSCEDMKRNVFELASYLLSIGVGKGDRVAIFSGNRWEWWAADLATLSIGAVTVPIYATNSADETRYIIEHSGAKICYAGDELQLEKVLSVKRKISCLEKILYFGGKAKGGAVPFEKALVAGRKSGKEKDVLRRAKAVKGKSAASIMYTSGTTGSPKGVVISHDNLFYNVLQCADSFGRYVNESDRFLSFLPLSHAFEHTISFHTAIYLNTQVAFAESFKTISRDLRDIQPSIVITVPRLLEKIHTGINESVSSMSFVKRAVIKWAFRIGRENIPNVCANRESEGWLAKKISFAEKKVFSAIKREIGFSNIKLIVSGGGPLSHSDNDFFLSMGLNLFEGYGLTEASPVTHANFPGRVKPGTVGSAMKWTEHKISEEGEILVKGPQVAKEYYRDKAATKLSFTRDGFFRTGDLGRIDADGHLTITGRIKDIIVTSGGKNISPQNIEAALLESKYIENVAIVGDRRKHLAALIIPDFSELFKWAARAGVKAGDKFVCVTDEKVRAFYRSILDQILRNFARVEQIPRFTLLADAWGIESGELTPTLKVKRRVIEKKYATIIDEMYNQA
jgi:long-chain acyl-CoA synthetase